MPEMIDRLIINSPFEEPKQHWNYNIDEKLFELVDGRRSAGYVRATEGTRSLDDPGIFVELPLVNKIRPRIKAWREAGYPGTTGITRKLLSYWNDPEEREDHRFFFTQLEAIETLIWFVEAPASERVGIDVPSDGGTFQRLCSKMATGSGKTVVMAMLITWHILNKATYPQDVRFSKNILVVAPGLTVRERLQVLIPDSVGNYYDEFSTVPPDLKEKLRQGKVTVINWHKMLPEDDSKGPRVVKKGHETDEAFCRRVLSEFSSSAKNILVINDEAHHAWRLPAESKVKGVKKEDIEEATVWIDGLDRINWARGILRCHDFSATPFVPTGKKSTDEMLFTWIISDFGLNDAIESGLVKTPRVVIRDDGQLGSDYKSRFYHIYQHVRDDLNRKAEDEEPLPDLVSHAFYFLGLDWLETYKDWMAGGHKVPPVMITVANRTETSARIYHSFIHKRIKIDELSDPTTILKIDSKVLKDAEALDSMSSSISGSSISGSRADMAEQLRRVVDTVGKEGEPGEQVRFVISVGMLSEGWDAKTVTQILGLRAFSSQLLCEQVVGRGLRRTDYEINKETGLYDPEHVNIFGIPFSFIPHEGSTTAPKPPKSRTLVRPKEEKQHYEIKWPNVIRINHSYTPKLSIDLEKLEPLVLKTAETPTLAELAPVIDGKPDVMKVEDIDLEYHAKKYRLQTMIFENARDVYDLVKPEWKGNKEFLLAQVIRIVEQVLKSDKIRLDTTFTVSEKRKRILLLLNMKKVVQHIFDAIRFENAESIEPVFDPNRPIKSTEDMSPWYTGKPCEPTRKSHISHVVFDSTWEASEAFELERSKNVVAWVKNDHLGFEIQYIYEGVVRRYRPDFLIRLANESMLILEVKGRKKQRDVVKTEFLDEWVRAVNLHGGFGKWSWVIVENVGDMRGVIEQYSEKRISTK